MFNGEAAKERIREVFCPDCKLNKGCNSYQLEDRVCKNFIWKSKKLQEEQEKEVRKNQAVTRWIEKGRDLNEIWNMSETELLSALPKPATASPADSKKQTSPFPKIKTSAKQSQKGYLYFYCTKENKQKLFKRNLNNPSEIKSFRKYLLANGYNIIKEITENEN